MSKNRTLFSRPRTKVYDSNYNMGESYYRPALERLDRKYGGGSYGSGGGLGGFGGGNYGGSTYPGDLMGPSANGDVFGSRAAPPPPADLPRPLHREVEDDFFGDSFRRRPHSAIIDEFDSMFEGRMRNGVAQERAPARGSRMLDEEIEGDMASSMRRLKTKGSRAMEEFEEMESNLRKGRPRLEFSDKIMDSVGLSRGARSGLEDEGFGRRRFLRMTSDPEGGAEDMMKWTALKSTVTRRQEEVDDSGAMQSSAAAARARKSRARLEDLESEMQALSEKSAAREKRVRDLKALVEDNEASALDNLQTTVRVKSSIQSEKKTVAF